MRTNVVRACLIGASLLPAGCMSYWTQMPTFQHGDPQLEKRGYERFDPFPDEDLGPDTMTRPRGFMEQRTMPRRAIEDRGQQFGQPAAGPATPQPPPSSWNYPDAVPQ